MKEIFSICSVNGAINWLKTARANNPVIIKGYFPELDRKVSTSQQEAQHTTPPAVSHGGETVCSRD